MSKKQQNKVAIVTGAAMGYKDGGPSIGGAVAIRLAKDGYKVVVVDWGKMGERTVEIIKKAGGEAIFVRTDVTNTAEAKKIINLAKKEYGGLTCLVNCVAHYSTGMAKNIAEITEAEWDKTIATNLGGYFKMAKYSIPAMLASGGGTIINISSIESQTVLPNFSVYSVSKAAIEALTRTIAVDFAPKIRANAIAPGFVKIANSENNRKPEELAKWHKDIAKQYPMDRLCEVEEIASVVSFLASDQSSYINAQTIVVDGGKIVADTHDF